jgi:hypothetical protein
MVIFKIYYDYVAILQVMDNIKIDLVDVPKEATTLGPGLMLLEGTLDSQSCTKTDEVHRGAVILWHNKPKKASTDVILEGISFHVI